MSKQQFEAVIEGHAQIKIQNRLNYGRWEYFRIFEARRLDTGDTIKVMGHVPDGNPMQKMRVILDDPQNKGYLTSYRLRKVISYGDAENARSDLLAGFVRGFLVTGEKILKTEGDLVTFSAKNDDDGTNLTITARIPGGNPLGDMYMDLKPLSNSPTETRFEGIYREPESLKVTPSRQNRPKGSPPILPITQQTLAGRTVSPVKDQAPRGPALSPGSDWVKIRGIRQISPRADQPLPNIPDSSRSFCIFMAEIIDTKEKIRVYGEVPGGNPMREFMFKLGQIKQKPNWIEHHGVVNLPEPSFEQAPPRIEKPQERRIEPPAPVRNTPLTPAISISEAIKQAKAEVVDRTYTPIEKTRFRIEGRPISSTKVMRIDGSFEYFMIFEATKLDTGERIKVMGSFPSEDVTGEFSMELEPVRYHKGVMEYRHPEDYVPEDWRGVDLDSIPFQRVRLKGQRITSSDQPDIDDWIAFDGFDESSKAMMRVQGIVPGGDALRRMSMLVKPYKWYRGEMQFQGIMIEPDGDYDHDRIVGMIKRIDPPGLGDVLIERVVHAFKEESFHVIRYEPEKLQSVEGIGPETIKAIREAEHLDLATPLIKEMYHKNIPERYFKRIIDTFGNSSLSVLCEKPYDLCKVRGFPFAHADRIGLVDLAMPLNSEERFTADLAEVVKKKIQKGKSGELLSMVTSGFRGVLRDVLKDKDFPDDIRDAHKALNVDLEIQNFLESVDDREDGLVFFGESDRGRIVYFRQVVEWERSIAENLIRRLELGPSWSSTDADAFIRKYMSNTDIKLSDEQLDAVRMIRRGGVSIMTGGPGVGKTTTLKAAIKSLHDAGVTVIPMAPTGIASQRMAEATGQEASTIHSMISRLRRGSEDEPVIPPNEPCCLVLDETSMVNVEVLDMLLKLVPDDVSILFAGDVDQLPSIGPGEILKDLIKSEIFPITRLTTVYRQGADSGIAMAAKSIREDQFPSEKFADYSILRESDPHRVAVMIKDLVLRLAEEGYDPLRQIMILSPMKKVIAGVDHINQMMQFHLNTPSNSKRELTVAYEKEDEDAEPVEIVLREGDKVMQTRNDTDRGIVNGEIGFIREIIPELKMMIVEFNGRPVVIERDQVSEIRLAYAMTIHKSQGSESDVVIIPITIEAENMLNRNLVYTATTRGKKRVFTITTDDLLKKDIRQTSESNPNMIRNSTLAGHCIEIMREKAPEHDLDPF